MDSETQTGEGLGRSSSFSQSVQDFLYFYNHCSECGSRLHFSHFTDFGKNLTHETVKCPECGAQSVKQIHSLQ